MICNYFQHQLLTSNTTQTQFRFPSKNQFQIPYLNSVIFPKSNSTPYSPPKQFQFENQSENMKSVGFSLTVVS